MFSRVHVPKTASDEAEKPFWISYADLMTSLMVLFLVVMLSTLLALSDAKSKVANFDDVSANARKYEEIIKRQMEYDRVRDLVVARFKDDCDAAQPGATFTSDRVDFGSLVTFERGRDTLTVSQARAITDYARCAISIANSVEGKKIIKKIIFEGFASPEGTYLDNLNLSARRSERALCVLLDGTTSTLNAKEQEQARSLFTTAGASSKSLKASDADSRRIEMRVEWFQIDEARKRARAGELGAAGLGTCALGG